MLGECSQFFDNIEATDNMVDYIEEKLRRMEREEVLGDTDGIMLGETRIDSENNQEKEESLIKLIMKRSQMGLLDVIIATKSVEESEVSQIVHIAKYNIESELLDPIICLIDAAIICKKRQYNVNDIPINVFVYEVIANMKEACKDIGVYLNCVLRFINIEKEMSSLNDYLKQDCYKNNSKVIQSLINDELDKAEFFDMEKAFKENFNYDEIRQCIMKKDIACYIKQKNQEIDQLLKMPDSETEKKERYIRFLNNNPPKKIAKKFDEYIYANDDAKRSLAISAYQHIKACAYGNLKSPVVLIEGPIGSGKTEFVRALSEIYEEVKIPVSINDAGSLSPNGYKGSSVYEMILSLYKNGKARNACLVIDEFDKICKPEYSQDGSNSNADIQNDLLKLLESEGPINCGFTSVEPRNLMIILIGSFEWMRSNTHVELGFIPKVSETTSGERGAFEDNLSKNFMLPEVRRRIDKVIHVQKLSKKQFAALFEKELKSGIVKSCQRGCEMDNITLDYAEEIVPILADYAYDKNLGVSAMYSVFREAVECELFAAIGSRNHINITKSSIEHILGEAVRASHDRN